jgi:hypothetical protein
MKKGYFYFWSIVSDDRGHGILSDMPLAAAPSPTVSSTAAIDASCSATPTRAINRLNEVVRPQAPWTLVYSGSHLCRRLVRNSKSPVAGAAVQQIAQFYAIEAMVRGSPGQPARRAQGTRVTHRRRVETMIRETALDDLQRLDTRRGHPLRAQ